MGQGSGCQVRPAGLGDVAVLARMNAQLIRDEGSRNPMALPELEARMRRWLAGEWRALLATVDGESAGYALFRVTRDEYRPDLREVYLRQLFVAPEQRRRGIGRRLLERGRADDFPPGAAVVIDVLEGNAAGRAFWEAMGFATLTRRMRLAPPGA